MYRKWLYPLYVVVAVGVVCLCLVLFRDKASEDSYAESMTLNISRELTITYGETYTLPDNYIIVKPESAKHLLSYTATTYAGDTANLHFDGSKLEATSLGYFYIKFSIPGKSKTLTDTLKIHIVEPEDDHISASQKLSTLTVDEVYTLSDLLELTHPDSAEISITPSNDNVIYNDLTEKLLAKSAGSVTLTIDISYKAKLERFTFSFTLIDNTPDDTEPTDPPADNDPVDPDVPNDEENTTATTIILKNVTDTITLSVGDTAEILYEITSTDTEPDQRVNAVLADNTCSIVLNLSPYVIIQANTIGTTTITLTSIEDPTVTITINIIVS